MESLCLEPVPATSPSSEQGQPGGGATLVNSLRLSLQFARSLMWNFLCALVPRVIAFEALFLAAAGWVSWQVWDGSSGAAAGLAGCVVLVALYLAGGLGCGVASAWFKAFERTADSMAAPLRDLLGAWVTRLVESLGFAERAVDVQALRTRLDMLESELTAGTAGGALRWLHHAHRWVVGIVVRQFRKRIVHEFLGICESSTEPITVASVARHMQGRMLDDLVEGLRSQARRSTRLVWIVAGVLSVGPALLLMWYGSVG